MSDNRCQCEHESHFMFAPFGTEQPIHRYAQAPKAKQTLKTPNGTYKVCDKCAKAGHMREILDDTRA